MEDLSVVKILNHCFDPWESVTSQISRNMGAVLLSLAGSLPPFAAIPSLSKVPSSLGEVLLL